MPTLTEVARRAGVSFATAARVLGEYGYSSEEARRKVLKAAEELKYRPDRIARSLASGRTQVIGLVVADIENPFFAEIARGVSDVAASFGYHIILANTDEDTGKQAAAVSVMMSMRVAGLIISPASSKRQAGLAELHRKGFPMVFVDRKVERVPVDCVLVENSQGAMQAVSHLIDLGHRRIGVVSDSTEITTNKERIDGYRKALELAGLEFDRDLVRVARYTRQAAQAEAAALLAMDHPPTALFATGNFMTIGCLLAARQAGKHIPRDLAIVGFDDMDWAIVCSPSLTTVAQPVYDIGRVAAEQLLARMGGDKAPRVQIRLPVNLIVRESSGGIL